MIFTHINIYSTFMQNIYKISNISIFKKTFAILLSILIFPLILLFWYAQDIKMISNAKIINGITTDITPRLATISFIYNGDTVKVYDNINPKEYKRGAYFLNQKRLILYNPLYHPIPLSNIFFSLWYTPFIAIGYSMIIYALANFYDKYKNKENDIVFLNDQKIVLYYFSKLLVAITFIFSLLISIIFPILLLILLNIENNNDIIWFTLSTIIAFLQAAIFAKLLVPTKYKDTILLQKYFIVNEKALCLTSSINYIYNSADNEKQVNLYICYDNSKNNIKLPLINSSNFLGNLIAKKLNVSFCNLLE
jgi:hypothetical protein